MFHSIAAIVGSAVAVTIVAGCAPEIVEEEFSPSASHADYSEALVRLDLEETEMGESWLAESRRAVENPIAVETPFEEVVYFDPSDPSAVGYRFEGARGHRIRIEIEAALDRYFADVYRLPRDSSSDSGGDPEIVASRAEDGNEIVFEPRRAGGYLLRIQPELLRGGTFRISVAADASLSFPVEGAGPEDIWSYFGDPRDGGARIHEGIDIFAPRGTPLLAAGDSYVARVGTRDRGGKVVVLHDRARDLLLYYAHLDEHRAVEGSTVQAGDVVGTTGNTGNAAATPPHLHIGIYDGSWRRALDPWDFFVGPTTEPFPVELDPALLGEWVRIVDDTGLEIAVEGPVDTTVRFVNRNPLLTGAGDSLASAAPTETDETSTSPPPANGPLVRAGTAVRVIGGFGPYARVRTADGETGMVALHRLTDARTETVAAPGTPVRHVRTGDTIGNLPSGSTVREVGSHPEGRVAALGDGRIVLLPRG